MHILAEQDLDLISGGLAALNHVSHSFNTGGVSAYYGSVKTTIDGDHNTTQVGSNGGLNVTFPILIGGGVGQPA